MQTVNTATILPFGLSIDAELQNEHTNQNTELENNLKNGDQKSKIKKQYSESRIRESEMVKEKLAITDLKK